ncbi:MAG: nucleoside kinase [Lachnospiraceae bacterium]|nr:nucleoside kinase [Lachnospiraceae bacterium]
MEQEILLSELANQHQSEYEYPIILAMVDGKLMELNKKVSDYINISFITTNDYIGLQTYKRSVTLLMLSAVYDIADETKLEDVRVMYSICNGYYCEIKGDVVVDDEFIAKVKDRMKELVKLDLPINKKTVGLDEGISLFSRLGFKDKERLFQYRRVSSVNVYDVNGYEDYYYGYMVPSTGYLKVFDLIKYQDGFMLMMPTQKKPLEIPEFNSPVKLFNILKESTRWGEMLDVSTVGALNDKISKGDIGELMLVQEALQEKKIAEIANMIAERKDNKFVMIAGPSSSGKTTFSHRLSVQLKAIGLNPHPIACDDYFVERNETPRDENGKMDFECLGAVDVELFNSQMSKLLAGERVELPTFNFKTGSKEFRGNYKQLGKNDILVIEGIHCLNDKLSYSLPSDSKFRIFISPLSTLNIDEHNRIPTTDNRLIRRIIRDARTRGNDARRTIGMWDSVMRGEETNIYPFQENADVRFNSSLIYELAVLKPYAERLLFAVDKDCPEYAETKRLLKFLDYFITINSENIPHNSILREFVGGSCFNV